jgi:hypothetical protein
MATEPEPVDVVTAARVLGVTPAAVRKRIRRGSLRAWKVDGLWRVVLPAGREPSYPAVTHPGQDAERDARLAHLEGEVAFLRGLVAELTRRLPELPAGHAAVAPIGESSEPPAETAPEPPESPVAPPPRRGWLKRLLGA